MTATTVNDIPPIRMLVLTLTGRCNFACQYCYAAEQEAVDMTEETALAAVRLAGKGQTRFLLQFSGGEPLLRFPLIRRIVALVEESRMDAQLQIQTNGSLLTREIGRWLYDHQVGIGISCDGRPAVNDRTRRTRDGSSASAWVVKAAENLTAEGIGAGITCVVTGDMAGQLEGIADMAHVLPNIRQVGFDILREQGRGAALAAPDGKTMEKALEKTVRRMDMLERMTGRHVMFTQEMRVGTLQHTGKYEFPQCYAMNGEAAFVDVHGNIYACSSLMGQEQYRLGTVHTGRDPGKVKQVSRFIASAMRECRSCEYFPLCGGGCFSRWLRKDGRVRKSDAECAMKRFFIRRYLEKQKEEL